MLPDSQHLGSDFDNIIRSGDGSQALAQQEQHGYGFFILQKEQLHFISVQDIRATLPKITPIQYFLLERTIYHGHDPKRQFVLVSDRQQPYAKVIDVSVEEARIRASDRHKYLFEQCKATPPKERALYRESYEYSIFLQVESCNNYWSRVLIFHNNELALTRKLPHWHGDQRIEDSKVMLSCFYKVVEAACRCDD